MATAFQSPGVYVVEVPSQTQTIAGAGTSTAAFIGISPDRVEVPEANPDYDPTLKTAAAAPKPDRPQVIKDEKGEPGKEENGPPGPAGPAGRRGRAAEAAEAQNLPYRMVPVDLGAPAGE